MSKTLDLLIHPIQKYRTVLRKYVVTTGKKPGPACLKSVRYERRRFSAIVATGLRDNPVQVIHHPDFFFRILFAKRGFAHIFFAKLG